MSSSDKDTGNNDGGLGPAQILAGWGEALGTVANEFLRPVRRLLGRAGADDVTEDGALARAARGFPLAGAMVGIAAACVFIVARGFGVPMFVAAAFALAITAFASGALFEAGLARFAEAAIAGGDKDRALDVMRNHTPGYYGIVIIVAVAAMKLGALAALAGTARAALALVAAGAVSWAAMAVLLHVLPAASTQGLAARAGQPVFEQAAVAAALGAAVALLVLGPWTGIVALALAAAGAFKMFWFSRRMTGGVTGATLGAAQQAAEAGVLIAVAAVG